MPHGAEAISRHGGACGHETSMNIQELPRAKLAAEWATLGAAAIRSGNLRKARKSFLAAVKSDALNAQYRFHLALVLEALGEIGPAATQLTVALRLDNGLTDASRRLCWLLNRGTLPLNCDLSSDGLIAALAHDTADRDLLAAAILHHRCHNGQLRLALERGRSLGWMQVARELCKAPANEIYTDRLLLESLRRGIVTNPHIERLLTAIRAVLLLETPATQLADPALATFAVMLAEQCWLNEFVWRETTEEVEAIEARCTSLERIVLGDQTACYALLTRSMYRSPVEILGPDIHPSHLARVEPPAFREELIARVAEEREIRAHARKVRSVGTISDATSARVAEMYNNSPYPRWTSVLTYKKGEYLKRLGSVFRPEELSFLARPFEVLIAGCGTGRQAVSAAFDYGPNARVTAVDIATHSLGYASRMAERMGAHNLTFVHGDIEQIATTDQTFLRRFHVIECVGVLHHVAQPLEAWRRLMGCLAPGGLMLVGLYSASARRSLEVLKAEPAYPGPDCDAEALRRYRQHLLALPSGAPGSEFRRGMDFFSMSGFRDFFLHVSERCFTLPEIEQFLDASRIQFRGFFDVPFQLLERDQPGAEWPGTLAQWARCEAQQPDLFPSMYQFWCTAA